MPQRSMSIPLRIQVIYFQGVSSWGQWRWGGSGVGRWGGWGVGQVAATGRELQLMRMEDLKPSQHYNLLQLRISNSLCTTILVRIYCWG